ncbi:MAG: ABC transporter permease [Bacteroidetes bacterium]|nr:ABC transporter permease [Bacteroidota bacterium]
MASVAFAVLLAVTMKSLQKGVFDNLVKNVVSFYSGYIQIHQQGYWNEQTLENSIEYSEEKIITLNKVKNITSSVARVESFILASSENATVGCMLVGTQAEPENNLTGLKAKLVKGSYLNDRKEGALIAEDLAKRLQISVNDTVILLGQGYQGNTAAGKFTVCGIVRFGSPQLNQSLVFLPLSFAQTFLSTGNRVTTIAFNISSPAFLEQTEDALSKQAGKELEVLTWKKMMPDIEGHIRADNVNFYIFIGVLYLLIAFGIFGTLIMMLAERKYELGMMLAIGMKRLHLALMLTGETILISVLGTILGLLLSYPVVRYFELHPIKFKGSMADAYKNFGFDAIWPASFDPQIFLTQALIVMILSLLIGMFPLLKIMRMNAITNMKR